MTAKVVRLSRVAQPSKQKDRPILTLPVGDQTVSRLHVSDTAYKSKRQYCQDGAQATSGVKSTIKAAACRKAPSRLKQKAPLGQRKKAPRYYEPETVVGVVGVDALHSLLQEHRQHDWCSDVRIGGLLLLLANILKRLADGKRPVSVSAELARSYISKLRAPKSPHTKREALQALCAIGVLDVAQDARNYHVKASRKYVLGPACDGLAIHKFELHLPPKLRDKRRTARQRLEQRLRRREPFREALQRDLSRIGISSEGRQVIASLLRSGTKDDATRFVVAAIDGNQHTVRTSVLGQITTSVSNCPREIRPQLLIDGQATSVCDVGNAHPAFLPRIVEPRIDFLRRNHASSGVEDLVAERIRLLTLLSSNDFYLQFCCDPSNPDERQSVKKEFNRILNSKPEQCFSSPVFKRFRDNFPLTSKIIHQMNGRDHRTVSKHLQRLTADALQAALVDVQSRGIAAIPQVDALMCKVGDADTVSRIVGHAFFEHTHGVCCYVGDVRYSPEQPIAP